jgi:UDP-N-acetylmuramyl pentapeptide synthase
MKNYLRGVLCRALERRVVELRTKHDFTVVAVAGSVGKTSTKLAVARLLKAVCDRLERLEPKLDELISRGNK